MSRITHPHPQVGVIIDRLGGIEFTDGVAEVDLTDKPNLSAAFIQHGYAITVTPDADGMCEVVLEVEPDGGPGLLPECIEGDTTEKVAPARRTRKA